MKGVKTVRIEFSCHNCGAEGYEEELDADDIKSASHVSFPCDECPARIYVEADVRIEFSAPKDGAK